MCQFLFQPIHHLYFLESENDSATSSAGNIGDFISLECDLHWWVGGDEGDEEMQAGFGPGVEKCASSLVDSDIAVIYDMEAAGEVQHKDQESRKSKDIC